MIKEENTMDGEFNMMNGLKSLIQEFKNTNQFLKIFTQRHLTQKNTLMISMI